MNRRHRSCLLLAFAATISIPNRAVAQNAWLSLNLEFNTPGDFNSGGNWTVVGKADTQGFAGISIFLTNTPTPASIIAPPEFDVRVQGLFGAVRNVVIGHSLTPPYPLGIGLIGSSFPSTYVDPPGLAILGGYSDVGSFTGGVELATGIFSPGVIPDWSTVPTSISDANVFTGPHPAPVLNADTVVTVTTVRYSFAAIPEPAALCLAGLGAIGVMAVARRRDRRCA